MDNLVTNASDKSTILAPSNNSPLRGGRKRYPEISRFHDHYSIRICSQHMAVPVTLGLDDRQSTRHSNNLRRCNAELDTGPQSLSNSIK